MATKKKAPVPDPNFAHVGVGPSNEELIQKQAEIEQKRADSGFPKVELLTDAKDKKREGWGDLDYDPLGLTDPYAQLKHDYERPGFKLKLLSEQVTNRLGKRGYQYVRDENGDPVRSGKMVLAEIPERMAEGRQRAVIAKTNDELSAINDAQREQVERLKSDASSMGLTVLEAGDHVKNVGDGQTYDMGISVERGERAA